ncbi:MAG: hypothetical protein ACLQVA_00680 [Candidatus Brocadiia bacterium]
MPGPGGDHRIAEKDWRVFRELYTSLLDRYCQRVLEKSSSLIGAAGERPHQRYLRLYDFLQNSNDEIAWAFDDPRRSMAFRQIAALHELGLFTDAEILRFSEETRRVFQISGSASRDKSR